MKDPSSPMDVCPFCGKAFKRLKSHLPHCKMAESKNTTGSDRGDRSTTANQVPMKRMGTAISNVDRQDMKGKGKSKTGLKSQVLQDKTISSSRTKSPKVGKVTSGNMLTQQKNLATIEESKKPLQTIMRTSQMVTFPKVQDQQQEAVSKQNVPIQQGLILRPNLERTVPITMESTKLGDMETVSDQVSTKNFEGDLVRLSLPDQILEKDIVESSGLVRPYEQVHLDQNFVSKFSSESTKALMVFKWSINFPQERVKTQISGISPIGCDREAKMRNKALGTTGRSTEIKMLFPPETVQIINGPLGLQWIPQLYPNYVQFRIVPGKQDQWDRLGRGANMPERLGSLPELSKIARTESILERQSKSKRLMDVKLGELPLWLASHSVTPKNLPTYMANAWGRYYKKYINVKKGGAGGLTMLLAGYCILSYSWNYEHIKQDRWRKYH